MTDLLTTTVFEQFRTAAAVFEPEEQPEPASPRLEPLEEPEGPDAAAAEAEPSKKKDTFEGIELVPGTFVSFAVDTAEPAAEPPLQQVGGGANGPLMAALQFRTNSAEARFHRYVGFR